MSGFSPIKDFYDLSKQFVTEYEDYAYGVIAASAAAYGLTWYGFKNWLSSTAKKDFERTCGPIPDDAWDKFYKASEGKSDYKKIVRDTFKLSKKQLNLFLENLKQLGVGKIARSFAVPDLIMWFGGTFAEVFFSYQTGKLFDIPPFAALPFWMPTGFVLTNFRRVATIHYIKDTLENVYRTAPSQRCDEIMNYRFIPTYVPNTEPTLDIPTEPVPLLKMLEPQTQPAFNAGNSQDISVPEAIIIMILGAAAIGYGVRAGGVGGTPANSLRSTPFGMSPYGDSLGGTSL